MRVSFDPSTRKAKKFVATFTDDSGRVVKKTHFGGRGCKDYVVYSAENPAIARSKRLAYIKRHRVRETWNDPTTAATLSRYILWEKPSLDKAIRKYKVLFDLQ
jgi:hypothetical protein